MKVQEEVSQIVKRAVDRLEKQGGVKQVVWIGAGGSFGGFYGAHYFHATRIQSIVFNNVHERRIHLCCSKEY